MLNRRQTGVVAGAVEVLTRRKSFNARTIYNDKAEGWRTTTTGFLLSFRAPV